MTAPESPDSHTGGPQRDDAPSDGELARASGGPGRSGGGAESAEMDLEGSGGGAEDADELARLFRTTTEDFGAAPAEDSAATRASLEALFASAASTDKPRDSASFAWDPAALPALRREEPGTPVGEVESTGAADGAGVAPVAEARQGAGAAEAVEVHEKVGVAAAIKGAGEAEADEGTADREGEAPVTGEEAGSDSAVSMAEWLASLGVVTEQSTRAKAQPEIDPLFVGTSESTPVTELDETSEEIRAVTAPPADPDERGSERKQSGKGRWSARARWSSVIAIVLLAVVVGGSVVISQRVAASNLAAQQLASAVAQLEEAEKGAIEPQTLLDAAVENDAATRESATAAADSAAPALAAVAGMVPQAQLDAANAALAALKEELDRTSGSNDTPDAYVRADIDETDLGQIRDATDRAKDHAERVLAATRELSAAQVSLQKKIDALRATQVDLGSRVPEAATLIVGENRRAVQSFRDAVVAASLAVPAAQTAGGSGDAELLAYAAAVTALREDQKRAENVVAPVTPPSTVPSPTPVPDPVPAPDPGASPAPTQTPDPPVTPEPTP